MKMKLIPSIIVLSLIFQVGLLAAEQGDDNPTGVAGAFNGNITTGCSYDPYTGNAMRVIDDIIVPGSVGAYPLKWTRYFNSHVTFLDNKIGGKWRFSFIDCDGYTLPDGREVTGDYGVELRADVQGIHLEDGGKFAVSAGNGHITDPYGKVTTAVTTGSGSSKTTKITEPGGRYLFVNYNTDGTIRQVQGFDGVNPQPIQSVTYTWATQTLLMPDGSHPNSFTVLTSAVYNDGTSATYTYTEGSVPVPICTSPFGTDHWYFPLLATTSDVRYSGPMRQIKYQYYSTGNKTRISSERNSVINQAVSTITGVSSNGTATATETRGDGRTRTFNYYSVERCMDCPPPDTETCNPPMPLDGKLQSFTDFQNHATILTYEADDTKPSAGFITAVKDANQNTTIYTRSNLSWGILRITHPDGNHIDQTYTDEANPYYLASRTDENGHMTVYHRDDPANPNAITRKDYPDGTFETFAYNNFGQVLTHRMGNAAYQHFKYDAQNRGLLTAKTNPTWTSDHDTSLATDPQTTYTYYGASDISAWTDRIKTETDPRGLVTKYEYDHSFDSNGNETTTPAASRGLVTKRIHFSDNSTYEAFGYNKYGDKLWEENELRKRTTYLPDDYGRVRTITDPLIKTTTNDYTPSNNTSLSPYVHTTNSIYTTTTPTGIVTQNIYDENFRKNSTTAGFGTADAATTWFQYDPVGNPTKITDPRGSGSGDPTYTTITDYDTRNRKWHVTDPQGHIITFGYDSAGNILTVKRPDNSVETKTYNEVNRVRTDALPKAGPPASPTEIVTTTFEYYPGSQSQMAGELWHLIQQQTASLSLSTTFEYDPSGMKTKMTYANNTDYQAWTYDTDHNLIARRTVNGVSQLFGYDSRNRQISMAWSNSLDWATFGYDVASRMTSAQNPISIVTRAYDDANRLTLDRQNLQILPITAVSRKIHGTAGTFDVTLPLSGIPGVECRAGQGANGDQHQLIVTFPRAVNFTGAAVTTGTGTVLSATPSPDHTQVTINLSGVANAQMIIVTLSGVTDGDVSNNVLIGMTVLLGDTTGNGSVNSSDISLVQSQSGQGVTSSNFLEDLTVNGVINSSDVALVQGQSGTGVTSSSVTQPTSSSPNIDVQYAYDYDGKNTRLFVTSAGAGTAGYDLTYKYNPDDGQGRFKSIYQTGGAELFEYAYDKASNEAHRTNKTSGVDQFYGRDNLNRITERDVKVGTTALSVEVYAYDPTRPGLLTTVTRQELGQQYSTQDLFGYDLLPELMSAQYNVPNGGTNSGGAAPNPPLRTAGYNWDRAGNRTSTTDSAGSNYSYQVTNLNQYWTDGINNMGNGSEHELASYQNVNYTYVNDTHLRLVSGMDISGYQSRYELYYDGLGRCVVRILNGATTYYIYDGEKSILEYRSWSGPSGADVYGKGIDEILRRTDYTVTPARTVYYQDDHEGNTTHLTDGSGNIVEWYRYDAFGKPAIYNSTGTQITTSAYGNRFMFTGREYVATFGIYEYRNRAYHPGLGRFMSEDPKLFVHRIPLGKEPDKWDFFKHPDDGEINLFRYVGNDPLDFTDPIGEDPAAAGAILLGGLGLAGEEEEFGLGTPPAHIVAAGTLGVTLIYAGVKYFEHTNTAHAPPATPSSNKVDSRPNSPRTGPPNTTHEYPNDKGGKTVREFGPNGEAVKDTDHGQDHGAGDPHEHHWFGTGETHTRGPGVPVGTKRDDPRSQPRPQPRPQPSVAPTPPPQVAPSGSQEQSR